MCAARDRKPGFDSEFTGTVLRIKLRGEIDHHSAAAVRNAIDDMIMAKRPCELVINMSAVDFMDSSGLGLIMGRYNRMKEIGGRVIVADPCPATEKIMNLAGMERIIQIKHTVEKKQEDSGKEPTFAAIMSVGGEKTAKSENSPNRRGKRNKREGR